MKTKIICISGHAQHGKDTFAKFMNDYFARLGKKSMIFHYADLLKYICKTYFDWNGEKDEAGRYILQYIGTDVVRANNPDFWVDYALSFFKVFDGEWDYILIPDCRFPNEIDCWGEGGWNAIHFRIDRGAGFDNGLTEEQKHHPSETALDDRVPDVMIFNSMGIGELKHIARSVGLALDREMLFRTAMSAMIRVYKEDA